MREVRTRVIAGAVNGSVSLRVEVTGTGDNTALAGIMRLVAQAQSSRARAQALADRAAFLLTVVTIVAAVITLVGPSQRRACRGRRSVPARTMEPLGYRLVGRSA
jgi:cation transport ATPase